jgi:ribonucleoside-triphosphate reductase
MDKGAEALSAYVFSAKYARAIPTENGYQRETWEEAVRRVMGMHLKFYGTRLDDIEHRVLRAGDALLNKQILGSQRNMQYGGEPVLRKHERSYNCSATYIDRPRAFAEVFYLLLCGSGVGFSVQKQHVKKLPWLPLWKCSDQETRIHVVEDSIEGWALALDTLLDSYFNGIYSVEFDFSLIRPEGALLSSGVGFAPGPQPLMEALEKIRTLLDSCVGRQLRPIDAYDILMHAAGAVLSGGVRRSATLALFSVDDEDMLHAKSGNWMQENPQRKSSNNSAALLRGSTTFEEFRRFVEVARHSGGEPGFFWLDCLDFVPNPCVEVCFFPQIDGKSGVQFCNLGTINGTILRDEEAFQHACENAAVLATLQAGYTNFPFLGPVTEAITRREALIGISITGIQDNPELLRDPAILARGVAAIVRTNAEIAQTIGTNPAARCTSLKPEGSGSQLLNTAPGKHRRHARRYIRRVQANRGELPAQAFARANPNHVEASVWREGDLVLKFPIEAPEGALLRGDETALQQLEDVVMLQRAWIEPGKREGNCAHHALQNSVSNTVTVREAEWDAVAAFIYCHREAFSGVSLLPATGDLDYPQAPFVSVDEPERVAERTEWERLRAELQPVDYSVSDGKTSFQQDVACSGGACLI